MTAARQYGARWDASRARRVLVYAGRLGRVTSRDVAEAFLVPVTTANATLAHLRKRGLVERVGERRTRFGRPVYVYARCSR